MFRSGLESLQQSVRGTRETHERAIAAFHDASRRVGSLRPAPGNTPGRGQVFEVSCDKGGLNYVLIESVPLASCTTPPLCG
jgi:hypothetical protein